MTIYVVEDDQAVRDSLTSLLSAFGHRVQTYGDGGSFLRAAREAGTDLGGADLVIVDLDLPDMNGSAIIKALADNEGKAGPGRRSDAPRVIVLSGQTSSKIERDLRGLATAKVMRKPVTPKDLVALL